MDSTAEPKGFEDPDADFDQPCLNLLASLDETLLMLKDISINYCCRPEMLPAVCSVYDEVRVIIGDLRRLCLQQLKNSKEVMALLEQLVDERVLPPELVTAGEAAAAAAAAAAHQQRGAADMSAVQDSKHDDRLPRAAGGDPSYRCDSSRKQEDDQKWAAMRDENRDLRSQLLCARVQLQSEVDARKTIEQHVHIMQQKDVLQRIALQEEKDKVSTREDQIRMLEMAIHALRQTSEATS